MNADVNDTLTMVVEQTRAYARRMEYDPQEKTFHETEYESLMHCRDYELGDEVSIKIIGMFKRSDGDHKYVVVETARQGGSPILLRYM